MSKIQTEVKNILRQRLSEVPPSERNYDYPRNYKIMGEDRKLNIPVVLFVVFVAYLLFQFLGGN